MEKSKSLLALSAFIISSFSLGMPTANAATIYDNETTFLSDLGTSQTIDFEISSGFPSSGSYIGLVDGINYDAQTVDYGYYSGQALTGSGGTFTAANITFKTFTSGFGFYGLDLTDGEFIRVTVDYEIKPDEVFDITLNGKPWLTPSYFGLIEDSDNILGVSLIGGDDLNRVRAWLIDDLSVSAVPEPSTYALMLGGLGLVGFMAARRRKLQA